VFNFRRGCSILRGVSITDSLGSSGADFHVVSVSTVIHQPSRVREEIYSSSVYKKNEKHLTSISSAEY
jgi:hypothetical protein